MFNIGLYSFRTWGEAQTDRYIRKLEDCCRVLANNPELGRPCNEVRPRLHRMEQGKHVVFYREEPGGILVSRILHQRMMPDITPLTTKTTRRIPRKMESDDLQDTPRDTSQGVTHSAEFVADTHAAALRIARLQTYFDRQVLANGQFICSTQQPCKESHRGTFYAGQLPHVGTHYDLTRNGAPFRIVVVGQEYGHGPEFVDLNARRTMIVDGSGASLRFRRSKDFRARNPHMKGCTNILRLLFGKDLGSDHEGEFVALDGSPIHLFNCFALVNFLLCSAVPSETTRDELIPRGGRPGRSTPTMQRNCACHFRAVLELLEPTIIVVQGRGVLRWMKAAFDTLSDDMVQTVQINNHGCSVLAFTHPSAHGVSNWGINDRTSYLLGIVEPTVKRLLQKWASLPGNQGLD